MTEKKTMNTRRITHKKKKTSRQDDLCVGNLKWTSKWHICDGENYKNMFAIKCLKIGPIMKAIQPDNIVTQKDTHLKISITVNPTSQELT